MRISCLVTTITMALLALAGCSGSTPTTTAQAEPLELDGSWIYLGPSDVPHDLQLSDTSASFTDVAGSWSSTWTVKSYDNDLHHLQLAFGSGSGSYLPVGDTLSATYEVSGTLLTLQLAKGTAYPSLQGAGTCTSAADGLPLPDCKLYIKKN